VDLVLKPHGQLGMHLVCEDSLQQLMAPHGWGKPAGRVNTPASPEGAGRNAPPPGGSRA